MEKTTVLLVEDDDVVRILLTSYLKELGYHVVEASDGLEGLEMIDRGHVDLAVIDLLLPYVSGIGLVRIAKSKNPAFPIICITAHGQAPKQMAEEEHADRVILKPFGLAELSEAISELLS